MEKLYTLFGVSIYATKCKEESRIQELEKLHVILVKYIVASSFKELSESANKQLKSVIAKEHENVIFFLASIIPNFSTKLNSYGAAFKKEFAGTVIINST